MLKQSRMNSLINFLAACLLAGFLAACGGGGTNDGCVNIDPNRSGALPSCSGGGTSSPGSGTSNTPSMIVTLSDSAGATTSSIAPGSPGTLQVVLKDATGKVVPNIAITFTSTDDTAVFSPSSGTALTDSSGIAKIGVASGKKAGAFTAKAVGTIGATVVTGTLGYAVNFPVLTLSDLKFTPAAISAGGNTVISVTVLSGGSPYAPSTTVAFSSPCFDVNKATIGTPVQTQSGVAVAVYTDKGCGTADTVKASITTPSGTVTKSGTVTIAAPTAGSLSFVDVDNSNIALVGTGGPGRVEFSNVKFRMFDMNGNPLAGAPINFVFGNTGLPNQTIGGLTLSPSSTTTDNQGYASTMVANGTIPTSVRVVATSGTNSALTTISSILVVSSGVPDQKHFTVRPEIGNCEGRDWVRECTKVSAYLADHFSNPVPDGTAINFTTNSGMIEASCLTVNGTCTVSLFSSQPKNASGRVPILAYAFGEETLVDTNGNNVYDTGDSFGDLSPDIFRDDNENFQWNPGEPCIGPNTNGTCSTPGDGQYNGVLRRPQVPSAQVLYVSNSYTQIFSGSDAFFQAPASITCSAGSIVTTSVKIFDAANNLMPAGTSVAFSVSFVVGSGSVDPTSDTVRNVVIPIAGVEPIPTYAVSITCPPAATTGQLKINVTTPLGIKTPLTIPITVN